VAVGADFGRSSLLVGQIAGRTKLFSRNRDCSGGLCDRKDVWISRA